MKHKIVASLAIVAVLSACSPVNFGSKHSNSVSSVDMSDYFATRLAVGKQHLAQNRPTKAIDAFRQASYDQRHAADAYNGMAVAYTMLGRDDVAHRLFERAIEANPMDQRYVRNLARLNSKPSGMNGESQQFAKQELPAEIPTEMAPSFQQLPQTSSSVFTANGELKPVANEVHIQTNSKGTTPRTVVGAVREKSFEAQKPVSKFDTAFAHLATFPKPKAAKKLPALARNGQVGVRRPDQPIRMELPQVEKRMASVIQSTPAVARIQPAKLSYAVSKKSAYPIRVELPAVQEVGQTSEKPLQSKRLAKVNLRPRLLSRWIPTGGVAF